MHVCDLQQVISKSQQENFTTTINIDGALHDMSELTTDYKAERGPVYMSLNALAFEVYMSWAKEKEREAAACTIQSAIVNWWATKKDTKFLRNMRKFEALCEQNYERHLRTYISCIARSMRQSYQIAYGRVWNKTWDPKRRQWIALEGHGKPLKIPHYQKPKERKRQKRRKKRIPIQNYVFDDPLGTAADENTMQLGGINVNVIQKIQDNTGRDDVIEDLTETPVDGSNGDVDDDVDGAPVMDLFIEWR